MKCVVLSFLSVCALTCSTNETAMRIPTAEKDVNGQVPYYVESGAPACQYLTESFSDTVRKNLSNLRLTDKTAQFSILRTKCEGRSFEAVIYMSTGVGEAKEESTAVVGLTVDEEGWITGSIIEEPKLINGNDG